MSRSWQLVEINNVLQQKLFTAQMGAVFLAIILCNDNLMCHWFGGHMDIMASQRNSTH